MKNKIYLQLTIILLFVSIIYSAPQKISGIFLRADTVGHSTDSTAEIIQYSINFNGVGGCTYIAANFTRIDKLGAPLLLDDSSFIAYKGEYLLSKDTVKLNLKLSAINGLTIKDSSISMVLFKERATLRKIPDGDKFLLLNKKIYR